MKRCLCVALACLLFVLAGCSDSPSHANGDTATIPPLAPAATAIRPPRPKPSWDINTTVIDIGGAETTTLTELSAWKSKQSVSLIHEFAEEPINFISENPARHIAALDSGRQVMYVTTDENGRDVIVRYEAEEERHVVVHTAGRDVEITSLVTYRWRTYADERSFYWTETDGDHWRLMTNNGSGRSKIMLEEGYLSAGSLLLPQLLNYNIDNSGYAYIITGEKSAGSESEKWTLNAYSTEGRDNITRVDIPRPVISGGRAVAFVGAFSLLLATDDADGQRILVYDRSPSGDEMATKPYKSYLLATKKELRQLSGFHWQFEKPAENQNRFSLLFTDGTVYSYEDHDKSIRLILEDASLMGSFALNMAFIHDGGSALTMNIATSDVYPMNFVPIHLFTQEDMQITAFATQEMSRTPGQMFLVTQSKGHYTLWVLNFPEYAAVAE